MNSTPPTEGPQSEVAEREAASPSKTLSIVVPVYFNEGSLPLLFEALVGLERELAEQHDLGVQLIFVDDGSGDGSYAELLKIKEQRSETTLVKLSRNFGALQACKAGLQQVTGDCFMWLSADLQDPPDLIPKMVKRWEEGSSS